MDIKLNLSKSKELFEEAKKYLVKGVNSPVRYFKPYPFFVDYGKDCYLFDVDGNKYIDYCLAYGPMVLGHGNPYVIKRVIEQLERGTLYGCPTEKRGCTCKGGCKEGAICRDG